LGVANRGDSLIDYAVGKAGDLSKWIEAKLSFVFGIDVSKDNINNNKDGACSRYLSSRKKYKNMPDALFVTGNSSTNIRNGSAFATETDKQITRAVFGTGPKDVTMLGKGVYRQYGVGQNGFNISSCQFALHYFFENKTSFHQFLRNIAECTKLQGYFIGTCYDGKLVFNSLKNKKNGESMTIMSDDKKIFEITKRYDETGFPDDDMALGYAIDVYQESINKVFREYLVNFDYLIRIMEDYGFTLITKTEAQHMSFPDSTGLFTELFTLMENEIKHTPNRANDYGKAIRMTPEEKRISFLNRYFIFRKVRNVNTDKMMKVISNQDKIVDNIEEEVMKEITKDIEKEEKKETKPAVRKTRKQKVVLDKFVPTVTEELKTEEIKTNVPIINKNEIIKIRVKKPKITIT
jgi:hypothetical protein